MKTIILLNGFPRSGKDTFAQYTAEYFKDTKTKVGEYSSVTEIKKIAEQYFEWDGSKDIRGRKLLSDLKDLATDYKDLPFKWMRAEAFSFFARIVRGNGIMIFHVREPAEIKKLSDYFNEYHSDVKCLSLFIHRHEAQLASAEFQNTGDAHVLEYTYNNIIINDSTLEAFKEAVNEFCKKYLEV